MALPLALLVHVLVETALNLDILKRQRIQVHNTSAA
jgi:hypothetical protein